MFHIIRRPFKVLEDLKEGKKRRNKISNYLIYYLSFIIYLLLLSHWSLDNIIMIRFPRLWIITHLERWKSEPTPIFDDAFIIYLKRSRFSIGNVRSKGIKNSVNNFLINPHVRLLVGWWSVGWFVGQFACHNFLKKAKTYTSQRSYGHTCYFFIKSWIFHCYTLGRSEWQTRAMAQKVTGVVLNKSRVGNL